MEQGVQEGGQVSLPEGRAEVETGAVQCSAVQCSAVQCFINALSAWPVHKSVNCLSSVQIVHYVSSLQNSSVYVLSKKVFVLCTVVFTMYLVYRSVHCMSSVQKCLLCSVQKVLLHV